VRCALCFTVLGLAKKGGTLNEKNLRSEGNATDTSGNHMPSHVENLFFCYIPWIKPCLNKLVGNSETRCKVLLALIITVLGRKGICERHNRSHRFSSSGGTHPNVAAPLANGYIKTNPVPTILDICWWT